MISNLDNSAGKMSNNGGRGWKRGDPSRRQGGPGRGHNAYKLDTITNKISQSESEGIPLSDAASQNSG
eukprot:5585465-Ditylum_brightwellii.AAC.1